MTGDTTRRLVFGRDVPCPSCLGPRSPHVPGVDRRALVTWRKSPEDTRGKQPTPATHPCPVCGGRGAVIGPA